MASESTTKLRLGWLDVVRGLAAIIVYLQHTLERDSKVYEDWSWHWVNFGRVGVTAFFLVSGFVIPFSLERSDSLKKFWVSRFFRLYPLYWAAFMAVVACAFAGYVFVERGFDWHSPKHLLINATMIQQLIRIPNALPVFWTLGLEMLFYWIISAAFLFKANQKSLQILYGLGGTVIGVGVASALILNRQFPGIGAMFLVITACFGTVFYRYTDGKLSLRDVVQAGVFVAIVQAVLVFIAFRFSTGVPGNENELIGPSSRLGSALVGYGLFFVVFAFRNAKMPKLLAHLGLISYSVYLVHPFIWYFSPKFEWPILTMTLGFILTTLLATGTYYAIEAPFQNWGRKIIKRMDKSKRQDADEQASDASEIAAP